MRFSDVFFLDVPDVEKNHDEGIRIHGGSPGIRDRGLLESAVAAPQTNVFGQVAHPSLARMAAALAFSLVKNHAFIDGNKRTALSAALTFLRLNDVSIRAPRSWVDAFENVAADVVTREDLAAIIAHEMGTDVQVEDDE